MFLELRELDEYRRNRSANFVMKANRFEFSTCLREFSSTVEPANLQ